MVKGQKGGKTVNEAHEGRVQEKSADVTFRLIAVAFSALVNLTKFLVSPRSADPLVLNFGDLLGPVGEPLIPSGSLKCALSSPCAEYDPPPGSSFRLSNHLLSVPFHSRTHHPRLHLSLNPLLQIPKQQ